MAFALTDAVAPVKISVGGCFGWRSTALRRSGRTAWEKRNAPPLQRISAVFLQRMYHLHGDLVADTELFLCGLKERLPFEPTAGVEDCRL